MITWEYHVAASIDDMHSAGMLAALGRHGWELVGFDGRGIAFFKRPIPQVVTQWTNSDYDVVTGLPVVKHERVGPPTPRR